MSKTIKDLTGGFGVVTVMNAYIVPLAAGHSFTGATRVTPEFYDMDNAVYLDTLKFANFTIEGPVKTITGGQYANKLIKYGKTARAEIQDALGRTSVLAMIGGGYEVIDEDEEVTGLGFGDTFSGAVGILGDTFVIDKDSGEQVPVSIFIPQFLPDAITNLTQDAEGDATVFDMNGDLNITPIAEDSSSTIRRCFYEISDTPFLTKSTTPA